MNAKQNIEQNDIAPDQIAARAYDIYEREGRVDGRDFEHWVRAESELRAERNSPQGSTAATAVSTSNGNIGGHTNGNSRSEETQVPARGKTPKRQPATRPSPVAARN